MIWTWLTTVFFWWKLYTITFANKTNALYQRYNWTSCYFKKNLKKALKVKTCFNEVNVVRAEAKGVRSGSRIQTRAHVHGRRRSCKLVTHPKVLHYFAHWIYAFLRWNRYSRWRGDSDGQRPGHTRAMATHTRWLRKKLVKRRRSAADARDFGRQWWGGTEAERGRGGGETASY